MNYFNLKLFLIFLNQINNKLDTNQILLKASNKYYNIYIY